MMALGRRWVVLGQTLAVLRHISVVLRHLYGVETIVGGVLGLRPDIRRGLRSLGDVGAKLVGVEAKYGRLRRWCVQRMGEGGSGFRGKGAWRRASHVEGLRRRRVEPAWRDMAWWRFRVTVSRRVLLKPSLEEFGAMVHGAARRRCAAVACKQVCVQGEGAHVRGYDVGGVGGAFGRAQSNCKWFAARLDTTCGGRQSMRSRRGRGALASARNDPMAIGVRVARVVGLQFL